MKTKQKAKNKQINIKKLLTKVEKTGSIIPSV